MFEAILVRILLELIQFLCPSAGLYSEFLVNHNLIVSAILFLCPSGGHCSEILDRPPRLLARQAVSMPFGRASSSNERPGRRLGHNHHELQLHALRAGVLLKTAVIAAEGLLVFQFLCPSGGRSSEIMQHNTRLGIAGTGFLCPSSGRSSEMLPDFYPSWPAVMLSVAQDHGSSPAPGRDAGHKEGGRVV
ncbi:hypothetical protein ACFZA1_38530 [Streptomyces filipinensis]|uniref:hypothetical protein n=1 Tax=Streptomyces filipinensis TaxID=66887 RepID=UPI0036E34B5B